MTNAEKYREEILERTEKYFNYGYKYPFFKAIEDVSGKILGFNESVEWLLSEYEPPLLDNADNLKIGDWIMVKNNDTDWVRGQFIAFSEGKFLTSDGIHILKWDYARLLEYGE